jgi:hypothetical protein
VTTTTDVDLTSYELHELDDIEDRAILGEHEAADRNAADAARVVQRAVAAERQRRVDEQEAAERLARARVLRDRKRLADEAEAERHAVYERYVSATAARAAGAVAVQAALDALVATVEAQCAVIEEQHKAWRSLWPHDMALNRQGRTVLVDVLGHRLWRATGDAAFHRSHRLAVIGGATLVDEDRWAWETTRGYEPGPLAVAFEADRRRDRVPAASLAERGGAR